MSRSSLERGEPYTALGMGGKNSGVLPSGAPTSTRAHFPFRSTPARSSHRYSGATMPWPTYTTGAVSSAVPVPIGARAT